MKSASKQEFSDGLGKKVATIRKSKKMTQEKLAELTGLDRMTIALIETGKKKPSINTLYTLADKLNVEASEFFIGL